MDDGCTRTVWEMQRLINAGKSPQELLQFWGGVVGADASLRRCNKKRFIDNLVKEHIKTTGSARSTRSTRPNRTRKYTLIDPHYPYRPGTRRQQASEQAGYTAYDIRNPPSAASITQNIRAEKAVSPPVTRPYVPYDYGEIPETRVDHHRQPPNRVNLPVTLRNKKPVNQPQSSDRQPNVKKNPTLPTQAPFDWSINHGSFDWSQNCNSIPVTQRQLRESCIQHFAKDVV